MTNTVLYCLVFRSVELIDSRGCPVDPYVFPALGLSRYNLWSLVEELFCSFPMVIFRFVLKRSFDKLKHKVRTGCARWVLFINIESSRKIEFIFKETFFFYACVTRSELPFNTNTMDWIKNFFIPLFLERLGQF